jgi:hypothetical protein
MGHSPADSNVPVTHGRGSIKLLRAWRPQYAHRDRASDDGSSITRRAPTAAIRAPSIHGDSPSTARPRTPLCARPPLPPLSRFRALPGFRVSPRNFSNSTRSLSLSVNSEIPDAALKLARYLFGFNAQRKLSEGRDLPDDLRLTGHSCIIDKFRSPLKFNVARTPCSKSTRSSLDPDLSDLRALPHV